jgi:dUTP pyrophosphatase
MPESESETGLASNPASSPGSSPVVGVPVVRLDRLLEMPSYAHPGDAGADLMTTVDVVLRPFQRMTVPTGIALALPRGYVGLIHPRSGLAARTGLSIVNAPGTIDAGYRGEIRVCLINLDASSPISLARGDRIAQLVIQRHERAEFTEVDDLSASVRGTAGYGSTGGFGGQPVPPPRVKED